MLYWDLKKTNKIESNYQKKTLEIFLLCGPHLHARGPQSFLSRAAFNLKNYVLAGRRFFLCGHSLPTPALIQTLLYIKNDQYE